MSLSYALIIAKIIIFVSILNVWLIRFNKPTPWRGGNAKSMKEEFEIYGLSNTTMYVIGTLKVTLAIVLFASIWLADLSATVAGAMAIFMLGAIAMHFKANDPNIRSLPALLLFLLSLGIVVGEAVLEGL